MKPCPSCNVKSFSLWKRPFPAGSDGALCPNCGTRIRFYRYGLQFLICLIVLLPIQFLSFFSFSPIFKVVAAACICLLFTLILNMWPLAIHPWERLTGKDQTE